MAGGRVPREESKFGPGDRVRISAISNMGSARLLHGLTGEVVGLHPLARGWYKIRLDANKISPHSEWTAPAERLVSEAEADDSQFEFPSGVQHFP
jgi:hypothetical protein